MENPPDPGSPVVVVDEVVTSGGSMIRAIERAQRHGCEIVGAVALIDRKAGGTERIREICPRYTAVFDLDDFQEELRAHGVLEP